MNARGWDAIGLAGLLVPVISAGLLAGLIGLGWSGPPLTLGAITFVAALVPSLVASLPLALLVGVLCSRSREWRPVGRLLAAAAAALAAPALGMLAGGCAVPQERLIPAWLLSLAAAVLLSRPALRRACYPEPRAHLAF